MNSNINDNSNGKDVPRFRHAVSLGVGVDYHAPGQINFMAGQEHMFRKSRCCKVCILYGPQCSEGNDPAPTGSDQ